MAATRVGVATNRCANHVHADPCLEETEGPQSLAIAAAGVVTADDFQRLMSALMGDVLAGRITDSVGNTVVNAGGKLLDSVKLKLKYGTMVGHQRRSLILVE